MSPAATFPAGYLARLPILAGLGAWAVDFSAGSVAWAPGTAELFGLSGEPPTDLASALACLCPESASTLREKLSASNPLEEPWELALELRRPNAGERWFHCRGMRDLASSDSRICCTFREVTSQIARRKTLQKQEEELQGFFQFSLDMLCIADAEGRFLRLSPTWREVLGYEIPDLLGHHFIEFVHPEDIASTLETFARSGKSDIFNFENRYRTKDGRYCWIEWRSRPVGNLIYAVARDVTARREAENKVREQAALLEFILEDFLSGYWDWNVLERREFYSPKMLRVLGREQESDLRDTSWKSWMEPEDLAKVWEQYQQQERAKSRHPFTNEVRYRKPDGSLVWILNVAQIFAWTPDGKAARVIGVHLDITERKLAEQALAETNRKLQETLSQVEAWREHAERANRAKSAFVATMSHEIRTPLNAVLGMSSLLEETALSNEQRDYISTITTCSQALLNLIQDILDFSKIEARQLRLERAAFDPSQCANEALELCRASCSKNLRLSCQLAPGLPREVFGDSARLRQVLLNLVNNAIKFTEQGYVTLTLTPCTAALPEHWGIHFEVRDSGIGIDPSLQAKLFQPFTQADSSITRRFGGTGLGLSICRCLVEAMGGKIGLRSRLGEGTAFYFTLEFPCRAEVQEAASEVPLLQPARSPGRVADASESPDQAANSPLLQAPSILVCEDDEVNRTVMARMLERLGFSAHFAADGVEGLEICRTRAVDIILLDLQMPRLGGLEMARQLREDRRRGSVRTTPYIVAVTAAVTPEDREECLRAGMNAFVSKPVVLQTLRETLAQAVEARACHSV